MTATDVARPAPAAAPPSAPRRPLHTRLSTGHVLIVAAALAAAVANYAVLTGMDDTVAILVASADAPAGSPADAIALRPADVRLDDATLGTLVRPADLDGLAGRVLTADLPAGSPLRWSDLAAAAAPDGLRRMSIPLPRERAVGGAIAPGDRVDVIQVVDGTARFVVAGAEVLDVAPEGDTALGGLAGFYVSIAVDPDAALCLAAAIPTGDLSVVLSTGQQPVATDGCAASAGPTGRVP